VADTKAGFRGQAAHDVFQSYMEDIVSDPVFAGMPDARYDDGRIQWEAPSNRTSGQFRDSHHRRRDWWAQKAAKIGISTSQEKWISSVAKAIHPTKTKPCKKCGKWMDIRYVYPNSNTLKAIRKLSFVNDDFELSPIEDIFSLLIRLYDDYGAEALASLPDALRIKFQNPGADGSLDDWLAWLDQDFVPSEPRALSPGAMSNAPDRFDGFHSFNRCCRSTADTGRSAANLRSYTTDRRVFEYWASGDWIAADRLMGIVRTDLRDEACLNGHPGPCQADHIGPISLGFNHRPHFQLLCSACNSAKNNRMYASDIAWLIGRENSGEEVISWHSKRLWDICKKRVNDPETSLRLSKVLRDNRHSYMNALSVIAADGHFAFLTSLLELHHADWDVDFIDLKVRNHITEWSRIRHTPRATKYAAEQKARRSRIAFSELMTYFSKHNRNAYIVQSERSADTLRQVLVLLGEVGEDAKALDERLSLALFANVSEADNIFRSVHSDFADFDYSIFDGPRAMLQSHMDIVGELLGEMWEDERFTRQISEE
jgi:Alw26I/Eco31I/Esp3I family type II restriction endonuclease